MKLKNINKTVIFEQTKQYSYRDPAAYYYNGCIYLYFTLVEQIEDHQFFYIGMSTSTDMVNWSTPVKLTKRNSALDYSSPGNIIEKDGIFYMCMQTYCRPNGEVFGNQDSRIFFMKSKNLLDWGEPELIRVKGDVSVEEMGRMIDPYVVEDRKQPGKYWCFYKQNGVSFSFSYDLINWNFCGYAESGENVCVISKEDAYYIMHSPENGIGILRTVDFTQFEEQGITYLRQSEWEWAKSRITAGFILDMTKVEGMGCYLLFFHGDNEDQYLFGASLAAAYSYNLKDWRYFEN